MLANLTLKNGGKLAYNKLEGEQPGILFLGGFRSDMSGVKAMAIEQMCRKQGRAFLRFDYQGHGESSGQFEECTLTTWKENALEIFTRLTTGKQLIVGSSMGAWIALLLAIAKPTRVAGIVGIAAAPDFTEYMIVDKLSDAELDAVNTEGKVMVDSGYGEHYPITKALLEDGRRHLLLHAPIPIHCPVRLIHGTSDEDVPWEFSLSLNRQLEAKDVRTILIKQGDHRLSQPEHIEKILSILGKMIDLVGNN